MKIVMKLTHTIDNTLLLLKLLLI